jgi:hypothetical protein
MCALIDNKYRGRGGEHFSPSLLNQNFSLHNIPYAKLLNMFRRRPAPAWLQNLVLFSRPLKNTYNESHKKPTMITASNSML